ncbi:MAG: CRTAC1 family protein [Planctomycetaceae bacterium]|nr:CRTAC1 family protein [Planctomycetaceae bacterium]
MSPQKTTAPAPPSETPEDDAVIGRAFRSSLIVLLLLALVAGGAAWWFRPQPAAVAKQADAVALPSSRVAPAVELPTLPFTEITTSAGITFVHEAGAKGRKLLPETMGSGCAFFDYNNDGYQDILLVNSTTWPWDAAPKQAPTLALYQNDGVGKFADVTESTGLSVTLYGMGVAIGDYDNDGWQDVFVSAVGRNRLFHNDNGKFVDVTAELGVAGNDADWSTGCSWFDYDRDGDLDLFVVNYVQWSRDIDLSLDFRLVGLGRAYGPPIAFQGTLPYLYRNEGAGRFVEVAEAAGLHMRNPATNVPMAKSLGVLPCDLDRDGWIDIVVANDTVQNFLFHNRKDGAFEELGAVSGVAFDSAGNARGAMGIDAAYFRNDNSLGIAIGNFSNEMTALYVTAGSDLQFTDDAIATGLGPPSRLELKFGVLFGDFDLDGRPDLTAANGHLEEEINQVQSSQHYAQPPHFFWNCGPQADSEFVSLGEEKLSADYVRPMVGRGIASADIDGDGDLDLLLTANRGAPRLLRNDQALQHHWIRFRLQDSGPNRDAIGAVVELTAGGNTQRQQVMPTRGYLSQSELALTFGLGKVSAIDRVEITWPDGKSQTLANPKVDELNIVLRPQ